MGCGACGEIDLDKLPFSATGRSPADVNIDAKATEVTDSGRPNDWEIYEISVSDWPELDSDEADMGEIGDFCCSTCYEDSHYLTAINEDWCAEEGIDYEDWLCEADAKSLPTTSTNARRSTGSTAGFYQSGDTACKMEHGFIYYDDELKGDLYPSDQTYRLCNAALVFSKAGYVNSDDLMMRRFDIQGSYFDRYGEFDEQAAEENTYHTDHGLWLRTRNDRHIFIWAPNRSGIENGSDEMGEFKDALYVLEAPECVSKWWTKEQQRSFTIIKTDKDSLARVLKVVFNIEPVTEKVEVAV